MKTYEKNERIYVFAFGITLIIALSLLTFGSPETSIGNTTISEYEKAFDPEGMNLSVKPGDDFYEYVNGAWIKSHPVPADKSRYGEFLIVDDRESMTALKKSWRVQPTTPLLRRKASSKRPVNFTLWE